MKRALIIGHTGQDGRLLWEYLDSIGYHLAGVSRSGSKQTVINTAEPPPLSDPGAWGSWMKEYQPNEIYYLAAYHRASEELQEDSALVEFEKSYATHVSGLAYVLQAMADFCPTARLFYASSCLVFGTPERDVQNERTPYCPEEIYAITKVTGTYLCEEFRRRYGLFITVGILYNHESAFRSPHFFTQKVIRHAVRSSENPSEPKLGLGTVETVVDWSHAADYVRVFHQLLDADQPATVIVASGVGNSVKEFLECAYGHFGLDWKDHVKLNEQSIGRPSLNRVGDPSMLFNLIGKKSFGSLPELVVRLITETMQVQASSIPPR